MSRGLSSGQITNLEAKEARFEYCIRIKRGASFHYRFTTGSSDVDLYSETFDSNHGISSYTSVYGEDKEIKGTPFSITFQTTDTTFIDGLTTNAEKNNTFCQIYLLFRDPSTNVADTADVIELFYGYMDSSTVKTGGTTQELTLNFTNPIAFGFNDILGRKANTLTKYSSQSLNKSFWRVA